MALDLAVSGKKALIVMSGDPGVFAMAAAVFEILDKNPSRWNDVGTNFPGIIGNVTAAAKIGAPLGHDFCALNLVILNLGNLSKRDFCLVLRLILLWRFTIPDPNQDRRVSRKF